MWVLIFKNHSIAGVQRTPDLMECTQWHSVAFYLKTQMLVSQGSVETPFRWGGKRLHYFVANIFRIQIPNFCKNQPASLENMAKHFGVFFDSQFIYS